MFCINNITQEGIAVAEPPIQKSLVEFYRPTLITIMEVLYEAHFVFIFVRIYLIFFACTNIHMCISHC